MSFKKTYAKEVDGGIEASTAISPTSPISASAYAAEATEAVDPNVALIKVYNEFYNTEGNLVFREEVYSEVREKTWDWDWNDTASQFSGVASDYKPSLEGYNLLGVDPSWNYLNLGRVNEFVFKYIEDAEVTVKVINEFYDTDGTSLLSREEKLSEKHNIGRTVIYRATNFGATTIRRSFDYMTGLSHCWIDNYRLDGYNCCMILIDSARDQEVIFKYVKKAPANVKIYTELYDTDETTLISREERLSEQYTVGDFYDYQAADYAPSEDGHLMPHSDNSYAGQFGSGEDYEFVFKYIKGTEKVKVEVVNEFYDTDGTTLLSRDVVLSEERWVGEKYYYEASFFNPYDADFFLAEPWDYSGVFESGQTYELVFKHVR